ncbi:hypothetical protein ACVPOW_05930 [Staphylococcus aureus]
MIKQTIKNAGAVGVTVNGKHSTEVIVGTHVQQVADELEKHLVPSSEAASNFNRVCAFFSQIVE